MLLSAGVDGDKLSLETRLCEMNLGVTIRFGAIAAGAQDRRTRYAEGRPAGRDQRKGRCLKAVGCVVFERRVGRRCRKRQDAVAIADDARDRWMMADLEAGDSEMSGYQFVDCNRKGGKL